MFKIGLWTPNTWESYFEIMAQGPALAKNKSQNYEFLPLHVSPALQIFRIVPGT